jgi:hypothetical protein
VRAFAPGEGLDPDPVLAAAPAGDQDVVGPDLLGDGDPVLAGDQADDGAAPGLDQLGQHEADPAGCGVHDGRGAWLDGVRFGGQVVGGQAVHHHRRRGLVVNLGGYFHQRVGGDGDLLGVGNTTRPSPTARSVTPSSRAVTKPIPSTPRIVGISQPGVGTVRTPVSM